MMNPNRALREKGDSVRGRLNSALKKLKVVDVVSRSTFSVGREKTWDFPYHRVDECIGDLALVERTEARRTRIMDT